MELRSCGHQHFIQTIQGGSIIKILNVTRGRPTLSFRKITDIYSNFMFDNSKVKIERSCISEMEKTIKTGPNASACNANDDDDEGNSVLEDFNFGNLTLKQIQDRCKTKKRKHSEGLDASKRKTNIEASSPQELFNVTADDSEFMETLSSWRSKLSKNNKAKKKFIKDPVSTAVTQEVVSVVKSEVIENCQECPSSSGDSAALAEVKFEVPEIDSSDHRRMLYNISNNFQPCRWPEDSLGIVVAEQPDTARECMFDNESDYKSREYADIIPLQMVWASSTDILASDSKLSNDQSLYLPAMQYKSEECNIPPDLQLFCPEATNLAEDQNISIYSDQPDSDTHVKPPITDKNLHCVDLGNGGDGAFLANCNKDEFTPDAEVQAKISSVSEHISDLDGSRDCSSDDSPDESRDCSSDDSPDRSRDCSSDDSPEPEEKQLLASVNVDGERHANEATDKLISWDGYEGSSKLHRPQRLLSTRKAISPSSQIRLCRAMQSIDLHDKEYMIAACKGKLLFGGLTDDEKKGTAEGLNDITSSRFTERCNKMSMIPKPLERVSHPQGVRKSSHPLRSAARRSPGHTSMQSCAKSAISFSKKQMHESECLAMKLTNELKSMKDIMDDMLRSELCLTTSLRYKVNQARIAVKKATRAEEIAKRSLSMMARDCNRFCKLMQLADEGPPGSQDVMRKKSKRIAFADEAGGRLCQVRFFEDERGSLVEESDTKEMSP